MRIKKKDKDFVKLDELHGGDLFEFGSTWYLKINRNNVREGHESEGIGTSGGCIIGFDKKLLVYPVKGKFVEE